MMRALVVLAAIVATSAVAVGGPPSTVEPADAIPSPASPVEYAPSYYVGLGAEAGTETGANANFLAASLQAGARVLNFLWARAGILAGPAQPALIPACPAGDFDCAINSGYMYQLRAGIEARVCGSPNIVCAFVGIDVAFAHTSLMGPPSDNTAIVLPRAGLALGTRHVRFHIAFEIGRDSEGSGAEGLDAGLGYEW